MVEIVDAGNCCFCLPLRRGILAVGYFKLACGLALFLFVAFFTLLMVVFHIKDLYLLGLIIFAYVMLASSIIFDIIFIASAHKKNPKYLRIYYYFLLMESVGYLILLLIYIAWMVEINPVDVLACVFGGVGVMAILIGFHVYFIYLVRSEMRKLQLSTLFRFKSHIDEPECTAEIIGY